MHAEHRQAAASALLGGPNSFCRSLHGPCGVQELLKYSSPWCTGHSGTLLDWTSPSAAASVAIQRGSEQPPGLAVPRVPC